MIKPAQVSPLTAIKFAELSVKAGIPPGVINVLPGTGRECGQAIADHHLVRKLGFTGSTEIGHSIMRSCAESNLKKCSLELGGKLCDGKVMGLSIKHFGQASPRSSSLLTVIWRKLSRTVSAVSSSTREKTASQPADFLWRKLSTMSSLRGERSGYLV